MTMSRRRQEMRHYARMFLGVERLPSGVPRLLDETLARSTLPVPAEGIAALLRPYRKVLWVL